MQDLKSIRFFLDGKKKVSHDYEGKNIQTFSYRELIDMRSRGADFYVGIPAKQNGLVIIDVDVPGTSHKVDGRPFWKDFCEKNAIPDTYTVQTPSGGYHFYFKLPVAVNPETFAPPGQLAPGVDVKWNGWVGAPPSPGYEIMFGSVATIQLAPPSLLAYMASIKQGAPVMTFDASQGVVSLDLHRPFTEGQIRDLKLKLEWMQTNATLSREEWRNGIFAIKAGVAGDDVLMEELITKWTMNRSYVPGDELQAIEMAKRADPHGGVGPGTIFSIIRQVQMRESAPIPETPFTIQEILDKAGVQHGINKDGSLKIEPNENNVAAIVGALFNEESLYFDKRQGHCIYKGKPIDDVQLTNIILPLIQSTSFGLGLQKFRKNIVRDGIDVLLMKREKDPHLDYLKSLKWDGAKRIENFFVNYMGVPDSEYIRTVGKNFWTSLAARGLKPGAKFDSMVVLEGHEGIAKSTFVSAIGGEYTYAPSRKDALDNLDALRSMHQAIVVELPELIGLIHMDAESVKAFLAQPFDNIRALYARKSTRNERGFVFIGTTNSDKYLAAAMGIRRFWPIRIPKEVRSININAIKTDRDQLFAEAIHLYREGYEYWNMPKSLLDPVVETRVMTEALTAPIQDMLPVLGETFTAFEIYKRLEGTGVIPRGYTNAIKDRIEGSLRRLGLVREGENWSRRNKIHVDVLVAAMQPVTLDALI